MTEVVCAACVRDGKVLIAKRKSNVSNGWYEFPGGKVEQGETKEDACIREWQEECHMTIENLLYLQDIEDQSQNVHVTCFLCESKEDPSGYSAHSEYVWVDPEHIYDYHFFEADKPLVEALRRCIKKPMK